MPADPEPRRERSTAPRAPRSAAGGQARVAGARARIEAWLQSLWFTRRPSPRQRLVGALLAPLGRLTGRIARRRRAAIEALPPAAVPVVVIGNLVVGGAGKTPLVLALVEALVRGGWKPGIIASGYGARLRAARLVPPDGDALAHGDEPVLLARRGGRPVAAARARVTAVEILLQAHPDIDVIVSDDGLQHAQLPRDLEIAVFDERGIGNGRCLPAGPLRAPPDQASVMDAIVTNGTARAPLDHPHHFTSRIEAREFIALSGPAAPVPASQFASRLAGSRVAAVAAIGVPERFFGTLRALGIEAETIAAADHAVLDASFLAAIDADIIVMTEKDAVKCAGWADERCWALLVHAIPAPGLIDWLIGRLHGLSSARNSRLPGVQGPAAEVAGRPGR